MEAIKRSKSPKLSAYLDVLSRFPAKTSDARRAHSTSSAPSAIQLASIMGHPSVTNLAKAEMTRAKSPPRTRKIGVVHAAGAPPSIETLKSEEEGRKELKSK